MDIDVRSLADFKRFLALPGATIHCTRNDLAAASGNAKWIGTVGRKRTVHKLQGNAVAFSIEGEDRPSWHYFGKADRYDFDGAEVVYQAESGGGLIVYRLSVEEPANA